MRTEKELILAALERYFYVIQDCIREGNCGMLDMTTECNELILVKKMIEDRKSGKTVST